MVERMDGWTGGRADERTNERTYERTRSLGRVCVAADAATVRSKRFLGEVIELDRARAAAIFQNVKTTSTRSHKRAVGAARRDATR